MQRIKRHIPEIVTELPKTCGHDGAAPHTYISVGMTITQDTCPECHARLTADFAGIEQVAPEWRIHAHAVLGRAGELHLSRKTRQKLLQAIIRLSHRPDFILEWPEWCWDHFAPATGSALAFPHEEVSSNLVEPGRGGSRKTGKLGKS
jgi:hypothetical protein